MDLKSYEGKMVIVRWSDPTSAIINGPPTGDERLAYGETIGRVASAVAGIVTVVWQVMFSPDNVIDKSGVMFIPDGLIYDVEELCIVLR